MGDIQPSKPRPALRGVPFPEDSIPRVQVLHTQPKPTTAADTGLALNPELPTAGKPGVDTAAGDRFTLLRRPSQPSMSSGQQSES